MAYRMSSFRIATNGIAGNATASETVGIMPGIVRAIGVSYESQPGTTNVTITAVTPTGDKQLLSLSGNTDRPLSDASLSDGAISGLLRIDVSGADPADPAVIVSVLLEV